jgi:hypothetical protein
MGGLLLQGFTRLGQKSVKLSIKEKGSTDTTETQALRWIEWAKTHRSFKMHCCKVA